EARRGPRHLARIALPMADPDILVRAAVDRPLRPLYHQHVRYRDPRGLVPDDARWALVHLPDRPRLARAQRRTSDVFVRNVQPERQPRSSVSHGERAVAEESRERAVQPIDRVAVVLRAEAPVP